MGEKKIGIFLCGGDNCCQRDGSAVREALLKHVVELGAEDRVNIGQMRCMQMCAMGPNLIVLPSGEIHNSLTPESIGTVLEHILAKAK